MKPLESRVTEPHLTREQLTLLYFAEIANGELALASDHLGHCAACASEYAQLTHFLDALHEVPLVGPGPEWEGQLWASIAPRVRHAVEQRFRFREKFRLRPWFWAPALALLLTLAFLAGKYSTSASDKPLSASGARAFSPEARKRVLLFTLSDHLDRSQIVLAELVNAPAGQLVNITAEQKLADTLVGENRLLRQTSARAGDTVDAAVLDQLERVLLAVAHGPSEASPEQLDELRHRIEAQGLLFKVRVISTNVREKGMKL